MSSIQPWGVEGKQRQKKVTVPIVFHLNLSIEIRSIDNWLEINWSHSVKLTGYVFLSSSRKFNCWIFSLRLVTHAQTVICSTIFPLTSDSTNQVSPPPPPTLSLFLSSSSFSIALYQTHAIRNPFVFYQTEHWILVTVHSILFYLISIRVYEAFASLFITQNVSFPQFFILFVHPPPSPSHYWTHYFHTYVRVIVVIIYYYRGWSKIFFKAWNWNSMMMIFDILKRIYWKLKKNRS